MFNCLPTRHRACKVNAVSTLRTSPLSKPVGGHTGCRLKASARSTTERERSDRVQVVLSVWLVECGRFAVSRSDV